MILEINKIRQLRNHCGPCCVEIVLRFLGMENVTQKEIGEAVKLKENRGTLPHHLIKYMKGMGIIACKRINHNLDEYLLSKKPVIVGTRNHFMILFGKIEDKFLIYDPQSGKTNKKQLIFFKRNVRDYIVISEVKDMTRTKKTKDLDAAVMSDILCRLRKLDGRLDNLESDISGVKKATAIFSWVFKIGGAVVGLATGIFKLWQYLRGRGRSG